MTARSEMMDSDAAGELFEVEGEELGDPLFVADSEPRDWAAHEVWLTRHPDYIPEARDDVTVVMPCIDPQNVMGELTPYYTVSLRQEAGLGYAVGCGVKEARTPIVVVMDGDGDHPAWVVPAMIKAFDAAGADLLLGTRDRWPGTLQGMVSRLGNRLLARTLGINGLGLRDCTSGFFVARRDALLSLPKATWSGYGDFALAVIKGAVELDWTIEAFDIEYAVADSPSHTKLFSHSVQYWRRARLLARTNYHPAPPPKKPRRRARKVEDE